MTTCLSLVAGSDLCSAYTLKLIDEVSAALHSAKKVTFQVAGPKHKTELSVDGVSHAVLSAGAKEFQFLLQQPAGNQSQLHQQANVRQNFKLRPLLTKKAIAKRKTRSAEIQNAARGRTTTTLPTAAAKAKNQSNKRPRLAAQAQVSSTKETRVCVCHFLAVENLTVAALCDRLGQTNSAPIESICKLVATKTFKEEHQLKTAELQKINVEWPFFNSEQKAVVRKKLAALKKAAKKPKPAALSVTANQSSSSVTTAKPRRAKAKTPNTTSSATKTKTKTKAKKAKTTTSATAKHTSKSSQGERSPPVIPDEYLLPRIKVGDDDVHNQRLREFKELKPDYQKLEAKISKNHAEFAELGERCKQATDKDQKRELNKQLTQMYNSRVEETKQDKALYQTLYFRLHALKKCVNEYQSDWLESNSNNQEPQTRKRATAARKHQPRVQTDPNAIQEEFL